jgi:hypothetical protein
MGDHCLPALLLQELGLRKEAFPFDWIVHVDEFNGSAIPVILSLVKNLLKHGDIDFLLDAFLPKRSNTAAHIKEYGAVRNWIRFPHDNFLSSEEAYISEFLKYRRRMTRLYKKLLLGKPVIFVCITRSYLLSPRDMKIIQRYLLSVNSASKFVFLTGQHSIQTSEEIPGIISMTALYREKLPAFVEYSDSLYHNHDLKYWRQDVMELLLGVLETI